MVLLTQLGGLGAIGVSAWKILGQWYRFRSKNEVRGDDEDLFLVGRLSRRLPYPQGRTAARCMR